MDELILTPSDFTALTNQILENAFPRVVIEGEVSGYSEWQSKFAFFDLKDASASINCFAMLFKMTAPLEDGMKVRVTARPKLTEKGKFSLTVEQVVPAGEGAIRRAFDLLKAKLDQEGLFDEDKKRSLPEIPKTIGLISSQSAAGATDFLTILKQRWGGVEVKFASVQVQGDAAPSQIASAINYFNEIPEPVDVLVLVRGGGSLEDLMAFNTEIVARAVRSSVSPIIVGVGHEDDVSLADLAADVRAATPTHAASLVVPDRHDILGHLEVIRGRLASHVENQITGLSSRLKISLVEQMHSALSMFEQKTLGYRRSLKAYDPQAALRRGYSVLSLSGKVIASTAGVKAGDTIEARLSDGQLEAEVTDVRPN